MPSIRPMSDSTTYKPLSRIPERRSSRLFHPHADTAASPSASGTHVRPAEQTLKPPDIVTVRGKAVSPLKIQRSSIGGLESRTFVPALAPTDVLDLPTLAHPRLSLDVRLSAPLFMGGATVEGEVQIKIDADISERRRKSLPALAILRISVSVVGIEHCKDRQEIFRALTTNILHFSDDPATEDLTKSFSVDLPVVMGPPPYKTKKAGIRYLLSCLVELEISKKPHLVRQTREIIVLTVHDPEKALVNLSNPLIVSDQLRTSRQSISITAGIHRQTWIGGYLLFVDVHIKNESSTKAVKKVELQLERVTIYYDHSAPSSGKSTADTLRLPDQIHKEILVRKNVLQNPKAIQPLSQDFRTAHLSIPPGLVSIETGRFFGVRYFLNIQISCSYSKRLKLQLPITLIHPNSIDIPPNALAQVTASIEHKHRDLSSMTGSSSPYHYRPGQAFAAARRHSYLQLRQDTFGSTDLDSITRAVERSPRKYPPVSQADSPFRSPQKMKITRRQSTTGLGCSESSNHRHHGHHHHRRRSSQHASFENGRLRYNFPRSSFEIAKPAVHHARRPSQQRVSFEDTSTATASKDTGTGRSDLESHVLRHLRGLSENSGTAGGGGGINGRGVGPRLQKSTSGMGFSDSDKENVAPEAKREWV